MSSRTYDVQLWNKNHSHPEYPSGLFWGKLTLDNTGLVFFPQSRRYSQIVIHYDNVTSTYTEVIRPPRLDNLVGEAAEFIGLIISAGLIQERLSHLSIKFKLVEYDKLCVLGFCSKAMLSFYGRGWAENVETDLWNYKRNLRSERYG